MYTYIQLYTYIYIYTYTYSFVTPFHFRDSWIGAAVESQKALRKNPACDDAISKRKWQKYRSIVECVWNQSHDGIGHHGSSSKPRCVKTTGRHCNTWGNLENKDKLLFKLVPPVLIHSVSVSSGQILSHCIPIKILSQLCPVPEDGPPPGIRNMWSHGSS